MVRYRFPLNRQNKYRARISFQPIQVKPLISGKLQPGDKTLERNVSGAIAAGIGLLFFNKAKILQAAGGALGVFSAFNAATTTDLVGKSSEEVTVDAVTGEVNDPNDPTLAGAINDTVANKVGDRNIQFDLEYERLDDKCTLHVPVGLAFNDNVTVGNSSLGQLGALGLSAIDPSNPGLISKFFGAAANYGTDFLSSLGIGQRQAANEDMVRLTTQRLAKLLPGEGGLQSAVTLATQIVSNPNQRSVFQNVNIRTFSFSFKFIPLSLDESREIERIITFFRKYMYPEHSFIGGDEANGGVPVGYKFPPLFDVKVGYDISGRGVRYENLPNMEIHYCYLQSVQHNYNSSSMTFYKGGKPTEIDMTLNFVEYRTLSRYDIENEYGSSKDIDTYGPNRPGTGRMRA